MNLARSARRAPAFFAAGLAALLALKGGTVHAANDGAAVLEGYLEGLRTFEAAFRQEVADSNGETTRSSGRLYLQKPGRFRWDYLEPEKQVIVSDGRNLWLYDADLEQVTVKALDESLSSTPALLLAGRADVSDAFTVKDAGRRDGLHWLELTPKRADTDFSQLAIAFEDETPRVMELSDRLGQRTRIEFDRVRRNPRLADELFAFEPPAGADVIGTPR